jgi:hypothetical protein
MTPALLLAALPAIYWTQPPTTADALRQAGVARVLVPEASAAGWSGTGVEVAAVSPDDVAARVRLEPPGPLPQRPDVASATHRPWLDANGWRILRRPRDRYAYTLPAGKAPLAAAEGFAYGADAVLAPDAADLDALGKMLAFLASLPAAELPGVADVAVVDDGTAEIEEVLNLLVRRNLLLRVVAPAAPGAAPAARAARTPLVVRLGSRAFPREDADDPDAFALKVRRALGDEQRTLRLYGSEVVVARLTGSASRRRLHLLNYAGRIVEGLRVRLLGRWTLAGAFASGLGGTAVEDYRSEAGATEFSLSSMETYAVVDLAAAR